jgi:hypothetical protein
VVTWHDSSVARMVLPVPGDDRTRVQVLPRVSLPVGPLLTKSEAALMMRVWPTGTPPAGTVKVSVVPETCPD